MSAGNLSFTSEISCCWDECVGMLVWLLVLSDSL